ncbi:MAG: hypothetical protein DMD96_29065 [Candidatus Rokuibacteriota bacterium]|nr:MAG: hypothetical protein DMD96_29065 [Candidatus Rokubacteria bacterium]PYO36617.1 MAG: hypothetical protein DMD86_04370 [Candidatus Rokubacteria bacterium]
MRDNSAIEWTDATWNPVTGCTKVSPCCQHCYAERLALRLRAIGNPRYRRPPRPSQQAPSDREGVALSMSSRAALT